MVKERNLWLGQTLENVTKTKAINNFTFKNLVNFFSNSFYSINGLIFRPGIVIPKTFIYFCGIFSFYTSERSTLKDYSFLLLTSFVLSTPFYYMLDSSLLKRLKASRLEENNKYIKNLYKNKLLSSSLYAFLDNFLLNFLFFGCVDLLQKFNEHKGIELTFEQKKLDEIKKIGEENETLGRVITLNSSFIKRSLAIDKV